MKQNLNLLLVEDSKQITSALRILLSEDQTNCKMFMANCIAAAKTILSNENVNVVILDINLPDGSGIELLKTLKKEKPEIIVIMLSNHSDKFYRNFAETEKADYFFDKSLEFEDAVNTVTGIVKQFILKPY